MTQFPVLISIPHGGTSIPPELIHRVCISPTEIFEDIDPFTQAIYDLDPWVFEVIDTDFARAFVDLNRAIDDLPPQNPDGIIKSMTCYRNAIYRKGKEPDKLLIKNLIEKYYFPYHQRIQRITSENKDLRLALDCHSMAASPPPISPDRSNKKLLQQGVGDIIFSKISPTARPLICLGNAQGKACDQDIVKKLAKCFCITFSLKEADVTINQPFAGGYITRTYGNNPLPWIQVEINRSLYLTAPWFNPITLQMDNYRLMDLNDMIRKTLELYFK